MKYLAIYRQLKKEIGSGAYPPDSKLPSVLALMATFQTGMRTMQHALDLLQKEGLIQGIRSKGIFVRGPADIRLIKKSGGIKKVGVLIMNYLSETICNPYFARMYDSLGKALVKRGCRAYVIELRDKPVQEIRREIQALDIDALVAIEIEQDSLLRELERIKLRLVHVENMNPSTRCPVVVAHHFMAGKISAEKLISLKHVKILFVHGHKRSIMKTDPTNRMRWQGVCDAAHDSGVRIKQVWIPLDFNRPATTEATRHIMTRNHDYTGIIAAGNTIFNHIKDFLKTRPVLETGDLDVVVLDYYTTPVMINRKPIYACSWDMVEMGEVVADTLLDKNKERPRVQYLPVRITRNFT